MPHHADVAESGTATMTREAHFIDRSGREQVEHRPLRPIIVRAAEIEDEIARLTRLDSPGSRSSAVVNPGLLDSLGFAPSIALTIDVLLPGESTRPRRHNSSAVNYAMRGGGTSVIAGSTIAFTERDVWSTPPWAVYQHRNDTDDVQVRFTYSNASLLDRLQVHVVDTSDGLDPMESLGDPAATVTDSDRGTVIGPDGASLLSYEQLISPEPPHQQARHWPWAEVARYLFPLAETHGLDYGGRRLRLMFDPSTNRLQGTTSTLFATMGIMPAGNIDIPHRHTSAAINYNFEGRGWSIVGGTRYEWFEGDLMLSAPGWMIHGHAADETALTLTIQDSPLHISLGSLLWQEKLTGATAALGSTSGFDSTVVRDAS